MKRLAQAVVLMGILAGLSGCTLPRCSLQADLAASVVRTLLGV